MRHKIILSALTALASILSACNNDIFVEDTRPSEKEIVLEGDGGIHTLTIQEKGLQKIALDIYGNSNNSITYYDKNGNIIPPETPVSEIARINYTNIYIIFDILLEGNSMTLHCTELTAGNEWDVPIILDYGYCLEYINVKIQTGRPMELLRIDYDMAQSEVSEKIKDDAGTVYINNSEQVLKVGVRPYMTQQASSVLAPEYSWAKYINVETIMPVYAGDKWVLSESAIAAMTAETRYYFPESIDRLMTVPLEIPAHSATRVTCSITYSNIKVPFYATFINPVSQREFHTSGTYIASEPVDYKIHIENVN